MEESQISSKKGEEILQKSCWQNKKTIRSAVKIC